jgi:glycosyltransferase involved in cell wall biosynthesis
MRLLHVTQRYPPAIGGAEKYIADLSEELAQRGHLVDVFTSCALDFHTWQNELPPFERLNGVNVYRFRSMRRRKWVWEVLHFGLWHYWRTRAWWYEPFIFFGGGPLCPGMFWNILRRGRQYDLIHLNCLVYAHVAYGYWAARMLNVPVIVTPHAHAEQETTYNIGYQRAVLAGCDYILAVTPAEKAFLISLGLSPERVGLGGNGLQLAQYPPGDTRLARQQLGLPPDKFILLFLGRKDKYKGLETALKAFLQLQPQYPDLHLLAVGPETDDSRAMWPQYQGLENLHVLGAVSDEEKVVALQACDGMVLPSLGEAFGIVFLEAWIMGKPVIGARILAVSAVVDDGRDGLLAAPGDVSDLARCIANLVDNPDRCRDMGQRGREKVLSRYTVPRITDRVEDAYRLVLQARGVLRA